MLTLTPSADVPGSSYLTFVAPDYLTGSSYSYLRSISTCQSVLNTGTLSCSYNAASKTLQVNGIAPSSGTAMGTKVQLLITNFLMPPSTSVYSGFSVALWTSANQRFNRDDSVTLQVSNPITISNIVATLPNNTVGIQGKLFVDLVLPAPLSKGSEIRLTFSNFDNSTCSMVSSLGALSTNCYSLQLTTDLQVAQKISLIFTGLVNNQETTDGTFLLEILDPSSNIAMKSALITLPFIENVLGSLSFQATSNTYGSSSNLSIQYTSPGGYKSGAQFKVIIGPAITLSSPILCKLQNTLVSCSASSGTVTFSSTSAIAANSNIAIELSSSTLPLCNGNHQATVQVIKVESGSGSLKQLSVANMTVLAALQNETVGWTEARYSLSLEYPITLQQNSIVKAYLPQDMIWTTGSSCSVAGLDLAAACAYQPDHSLTISNSMSTSKLGTASFTLTLQNFTNPRRLGTFPLKIQIVSSSSCIYLNGEASITVSSLPSWNSITLTPSKSYLSTYHALEYELKPPKDPFVGDKVVLSSATSMPSTSPESITGKLYTPKSAIQYYLSPNSASSVLFNVNLVDSSGNVVLLGTNSVPYSGDLPGNSSAHFDNLERGKQSNLTYSIAVDSYLPSGTKIVLSLSNNFPDFSTIALISSIPSGTFQLDIEKRLAIVTLSENTEEKSPINVTLKLTNPQSEQMALNEVNVSIVTLASRSMFIDQPFKSSVQFICQLGCATCNKLSTDCLSCQQGFSLVNSNQCVESSKVGTESIKYPPIFLFPVLSLIALVISLVVYKFKRVSHPLNLTFYVNRLISVIFGLVVMVLFFVKLGRNYGGMALGIIFLSLLLSIGWCCIDTPAKRLEKFAWIAGVGCIRIGVVGFGTGINHGWRNAKGMNHPELTEEIRGQKYMSWRSKNTAFCLISCIINIGFVILGIITFVGQVQFFLSLELAVFNILDIIIFVSAWIELNVKDSRQSLEVDIKSLKMRASSGSEEQTVP
jgi:hypothetical protein